MLGGGKSDRRPINVDPDHSTKVIRKIVGNDARRGADVQKRERAEIYTKKIPQDCDHGARLSLPQFRRIHCFRENSGEIPLIRSRAETPTIGGHRHKEAKKMIAQRREKEKKNLRPKGGA